MEYEQIKDIPSRPSARENLKELLQRNKEIYFNEKTLTDTCGFRTNAYSLELRKGVSELIRKNCPVIEQNHTYAWTEEPIVIQKHVKKLQTQINFLNEELKVFKEISKQLKTGCKDFELTSKNVCDACNEEKLCYNMPGDATYCDDCCKLHKIKIPTKEDLP